MKIKSLIIAFAALAISFNVSAQEVSFGVKAGASANWIPGTVITGFETAIVPHIGFYGGFVTTVEFGDFLLGQAELLYAGKGHTDRTQYLNYLGKYSMSLHYLQLPVMVGARMFNGKATLMLGPELGYCFAAKVVDSDNLGTIKYDVKEYVNPFNLALALQANYMFSDHFGLDIKFDFGLTKTFKDVEFTIGKHTRKDNGRNSSIQFGVCYVF